MSAAHPRDRLLRKRLGVFTKMLHGVAKGDVRALHRTRVSSRRLRELLPILQLDNQLTRKLGKRLRRVTKRLGTVRELDVLLQILDELAVSGKYSARALSQVSGALVAAREQAHERVQTSLPTSRLSRLAHKLKEVADELRATLSGDGSSAGAALQRESAWRWALDARIARRAERLSHAMAEAGAVYLPDRLHEVRIAVKKLRYAVELRAESTDSRRRGPELRLLRQAQDLLGRTRDLQVLIDHVRQFQASLELPDTGARGETPTVGARATGGAEATPGPATGVRPASGGGPTSAGLGGLVQGLETECRRLHARYMRIRPRLDALCTRLLARPHFGSRAHAGSRAAHIASPRRVTARRAIAS